MKFLIKVGICLIAVFDGYTFRLFSQNLLRNGGFEKFIEPPNAQSQWTKCLDWGVLLYTGDSATPDYYHEDYLSLNIRSGNTTVFPRTGKASMGISAAAIKLMHPHNGDIREYVSVKFVKPMELGKKYKISFWITNGEVKALYGIGCNGMGIDLSVKPNIQRNTKRINKDADINIPEEIWTTTWKEYSFEFIADSTYNYLTFGNFFPDSMISFTPHVPGPTGSFRPYYILDDFSVLPGWLYITGDTTVCKGQFATLQAYNDSNYKWALSSNIDSIIHQGETIKVRPQQTTEYILIGTEDTARFTVYVKDIGSINLGNDTTICFGENLALSVEPGKYEYIWDGFNTDDMHVVNTQGDHWVAASRDGCTIYDTLHVSLKKCECLVSIPNSFSPNGDELNEEFTPVFDCSLNYYHLSIFNRWGEVVFETNDQKERWTGNNTADTFVYHLKYEPKGGGYFEKKGIIHAVK